MTDEKRIIKTERTALGLVSAAHFFSHFYLLTLPPLFLAIQAELEVDFTQLGLIVTAYGVGSATGQYPMGVMADKFGPRWLMIGGMVLLSATFFTMGFVTSYWMMLPLALLAGFGDSAFHPCDFAVMGATIREERLGRAYAFHAFSGFAGFAFAMLVVPLVGMHWFWNRALKLAGALGGVMAIVLIIGKGYLIHETTADGVKSVSIQSSQVGAFTLLRSPPLIMLFFFYVAVAIGGQGIQQFSPSALPMLFDVSELQASQSVAMYIISMTIGILVGGYVADKLRRLDLIATIGYLVSIVMMIIVALAIFPFLMVQIAFVVSGFMVGIVMPARDLMVRSVSPKGASGKSFGFVNSGFGYGAVFGPPIYGWIMDQGWIEGIYYVTAGFMAMVIVTALASTILARSQTQLQPAE